MSIDYQINHGDAIPCPVGEVRREEIRSAALRTNEKLRSIHARSCAMHVNIFEVIDLRFLSGMVGETFATSLCEEVSFLRKNPHIDGYPDLLEVNTPAQHEYYSNALLNPAESFKHYKHGAFEVKNTFGIKKTGVQLFSGDRRLGRINPKLVWKAHHQKTNHLFALLSDFNDGVPFVAAVFYRSDLNESDWTEKQEPAEGGRMTSFCMTTPLGSVKIRSNPIVIGAGYNCYAVTS